MKVEDIKQLYDGAYAASYDAKFLHSELTAADTRYELKLLETLLKPGMRWLDVACGTGYFLRHFPLIERTGTDISPAMLERARQGNVGVTLREHDYRHRMDDWIDRFDLVSCMWYAYCYADTVAEVAQLIENLASWTAPSGTCFMPLADPDLITGQTLPYRHASAWPGEVLITGISWTYVDENGAKAHKHLVSPNIEFMTEHFREFFRSVKVIRYPDSNRPALLATGKRR